MTRNATVRVSVVTAVRNACSTIRTCLNSVATQTHAHRQHVIVDGQSTDGTMDLLTMSSDRIDVLISERDTGIYNALNKGLRRCTGDVIGFLHADDVYASEHALTKVAEAFGDPEVSIVYGDLLYVSKTDISKPIRYWKAGAFDSRKLAGGWMPPHPTMYVRRAIYEEVGGFDESYRIAGDYDCMLRILSRPGLKAAYVPEVLVRMRLGGKSNASLKAVLRKSAEDYRALRHNRIGGVLTLLGKNLRKVRQFTDTPPQLR
jgi:glycosyltransferase involved in cell wall biosynthesis